MPQTPGEKAFPPTSSPATGGISGIQPEAHAETVSAGVSPPAGAAQPRRGAWMGAYLLLVLAFGFSAWQISRGSEDANLVAAFAVAVTIVTALLQTSLPLETTGLVTLAAGITVVAGAFTVSTYLDHQTLDVRDDVTVDSAAQGMHVGGGESVIMVPLSRPRSHLKIVFDLADHNPAVGSCATAGQTGLRVRLNRNGNLREISPNPLPPGQPLIIDLGSKTRAIRLQVMVLNSADPKCVMDLSVTAAHAY